MAEQWNSRFKELLSYRSEHGDSNVPQRRGKLGSWVKLQRALYKAGSLAQDRIDRLSSIGFKWAMKEGGPAVPWETRFDELVQYKAKHGDCNVPDKQGKLGTWVGTQRKAYKANSLAHGRIDRLSSIGFSWVMARGVRVRAKGNWETRFEELVRYKTEHGDSDAPRKEGKLGVWVNKQRATYKSGKLKQSRVDRLDIIGFRWSIKDEPVSWETRFEELKQYNEKHGNCNVPSREGKLGNWVCQQRTMMKKRGMNNERRALLNSIGFNWSLIGDPTVHTGNLTDALSCNDKFTGVDDFDDTDSVKSFPGGAPMKAIALGRDQQNLNEAVKEAKRLSTIPIEIDVAIPEATALPPPLPPPGSAASAPGATALSPPLPSPGSAAAAPGYVAQSPATGYRPHTTRPGAWNRHYKEGEEPSWFRR